MESGFPGHRRRCHTRMVSLLPLLFGCCCCLTMTTMRVASGQRYADRNVLPASPDDPPDTDDYDYGDEEAALYGFREEEADVYKWNVDRYPHPLTTPRFCNRLRAARVCDPDLVLEREEADLLDDSIEDLYRSTPCICDRCEADAAKGGGILVGIALMKHLHLPYHVHHAKVIRSFAEMLRVRWKLGPCDNDILIVVATDDRLSYTDVGRTASSYLSIHEAHRIFLENRAHFSASNFSEGLLRILAAYRTLTSLQGEKMRSTSFSSSSVDVGTVVGAIVGSVLLLGLFLFLAVLVYRRRKNVASKDREPSPEPGSSSSAISWSKKVLLFASPGEKSAEKETTRYQKCGTDEKCGTAGDEEEDELDLTLAAPDDTSIRDRTRLTECTSDSETLEKDLHAAAEGLVRTFPFVPNGHHDVLVTDM